MSAPRITLIGGPTAFADAIIVPVHHEGWAHFTQGRDDRERSFATLGLAGRLQWLEPSVATAIEPPR